MMINCGLLFRSQSDRVSRAMSQTPPPLPYASVRASPLPPRSGSLMTAAVLCFVGALFPLIWLGIQVVNTQHHEWRAAFTANRLPFKLLLLEDATCALALCALLILGGVLLCLRAKWAVHMLGA